jgi:hypothetical protein
VAPASVTSHTSLSVNCDSPVIRPSNSINDSSRVRNEASTRREEE